MGEGVRQFEDLEIWQVARRLVASVYRSTNGERFARDFEFRGQMRRAAVSIAANIAEGFGRFSNSEFVRFLNIAAASSLELRSHLYIALDLGYLPESEFQGLSEKATTLEDQIGALIRYLRTHERRK